MRQTQHKAPQGAPQPHLLRWLWRGYMRKHSAALGLAVVLMVLEGSMLGALSWMIQPMFDDVFIAGRHEALWVIGFVILMLFIVRAFAGVARKVVMTRIAQKIAAGLRIDLLDHSMQQDGRFHQKHPPGYLIQRIQADVGAVNTVWNLLLTSAARDAITLMILLGVAINVDWRWTSVACVGTPLVVLPSLFAQRYVRRRTREARDLGARLATRLDEVFNGIVSVKLNRLEAYQSRRYRELTQRLVSAEMRAALGAASLPGLIDIMIGIGFLCVLVYGGGEIISGDKTIGQFMSFFTAMGFAFEPLRRLGNVSGQWQVAAAAIERLKELLDSKSTPREPRCPVAAPAGALEIALEDVHLAYDDMPVLRGLSFTAKAGQTTAIVGASGAGKSTVFNLLTRLVEPQAGHIRIGGVEVAAMALADLRGLFSTVSQDVLLFDDSLRENILLGRSKTTAAELEKVLQAAHVSDFLHRLARGVDSPVGVRGTMLSGGQRQRVAIARALLRDTPILLLDEATSALDAESETAVQSALARLAVGRTTLVIAHQLATIRDAHKIVVMERGRVVDEGTHAALLERGGVYGKLYRLQFAAKSNGGADRPNSPPPKAHAPASG